MRLSLLVGLPHGAFQYVFGAGVGALSAPIACRPRVRVMDAELCDGRSLGYDAARCRFCLGPAGAAVRCLRSVAPCRAVCLAVCVARWTFVTRRCDGIG